MKRALLLLALVLLGLTECLIGADRVIADQTTATLVFRKIAVEPDIFSKEYATERARQFLKANAKFKMIRWTLVPDEKPANYTVTSCDHCPFYPFWLKQWSAVNATMFPIAELMSIEGNAVFRFRDEQGVVTAQVITGRDPRAFQVGGFVGRIIHVGMHGRVESPLPRIYVVGAGEISAKEGSAYARELTGRLGVGNASIEFRGDPWFIAEIGTPFFPLFDATGAVPSEQEFTKTKAYVCSSLSRTNNNCSWKDIVSLP